MRAAILIVTLLAPMWAGCGESRSNNDVSDCADSVLVNGVVFRPSHSPSFKSARLTTGAQVPTESSSCLQPKHMYTLRGIPPDLALVRDDTITDEVFFPDNRLPLAPTSPLRTILRPLQPEDLTVGRDCEKDTKTKQGRFSRAPSPGVRLFIVGDRHVYATDLASAFSGFTTHVPQLNRGQLLRITFVPCGSLRVIRRLGAG